MRLVLKKQLAMAIYTILLISVALLCFVALVFSFKPDVLGVPPPVGKIITFTGGQSNKYCGVSGLKEIQCNLSGPSDASRFTVEDLGDGTHALKNMTTGQFCHDQGDKIVCHSDVIDRHEKFHWIDQGKSFALTGPKSGTKRLYCADEVQRIRCNRDKLGPWEVFTIRSSSQLPPASSPEDPSYAEPSSADSSSPSSAGTQTKAMSAVAPTNQTVWELIKEFIASLWKT